MLDQLYDTLGGGLVETHPGAVTESPKHSQNKKTTFTERSVYESTENY